MLSDFAELPLGSVKPAGWLEGQLRIQAAGLGGHLDEFWPDIKDSAWIGGKAEGWERTPFALWEGPGGLLYGRGVTDCLGHVAVLVGGAALLIVGTLLLAL